MATRTADLPPARRREVARAVCAWQVWRAARNRLEATYPPASWTVPTRCCGPRRPLYVVVCKDGRPHVERVSSDIGDHRLAFAFAREGSARQQAAMFDGRGDSCGPHGVARCEVRAAKRRRSGPAAQGTPA